MEPQDKEKLQSGMSKTHNKQAKGRLQVKEAESQVLLVSEIRDKVKKTCDNLIAPHH